METYKRQIKFCYYMIAKMREEAGKESVKSKFNLVDWIITMHDKNQINHNIQVGDCLVNLEQYYHFEDDNIYAIRVFKLRDANIPSKIKDGEKSTEIPLDSDEYIGEDLNFLYDRRHSICMIQQNRMSLGTGRLVEWINQICPQDNGRIVLIPISDRFSSKNLHKKSVRSVEFSFANLEPDENSGSLAQIINGLNKYNGLTGRITISVGRTKDAQLDKGNIVNLIDDLQSNPGVVNSAKLKVRDDDKGQIEIVDLFENVTHDFLEFDIQMKKPLDFNQARMKMYSKYLEKREDILQMCRW